MEQEEEEWKQVYPYQKRDILILLTSTLRDLLWNNLGPSFHVCWKKQLRKRKPGPSFSSDFSVGLSNINLKEDKHKASIKIYGENFTMLLRHRGHWVFIFHCWAKTPAEIFCCSHMREKPSAGNSPWACIFERKDLGYQRNLCRKKNCWNFRADVFKPLFQTRICSLTVFWEMLRNVFVEMCLEMSSKNQSNELCNYDF